MSYVARTSAKVNEQVKQEDIQEFNAQFSGFADSGQDGYYYDPLNPKTLNSISVQDFATMYNLTKTWNIQNPSDKIQIELKSDKGAMASIGSKTTLRNYIAGYTKTAEEILADYFDGTPEKYYFTFASEEITYNELDRKNYVDYIKIVSKIKEKYIKKDKNVANYKK